MPYDQQSGLFQDGASGPLWRASFADLDDAKWNGRKLADEERQEFFVFNYGTSSEVARLFPPRHKTVEVQPDSTRNNGPATREAK